MSRRIVVAQKSATCRICKELATPQVAQVNATIWPEPGIAVRSRDYRAAAVRACAALGLDLEAKSVTRHAAHIESTWHRVGSTSPIAAGEEPVHPTDYQSVAQRFSAIGMAAAEHIEKRLPDMEDRELLVAGRMGLTAAANREAMRIREREAETTGSLAAAIFGLSSQLISEDDIPESEVIDVTPVEDLLDEVRSERQALKRLQTGEAVRA